MDYTKNLPVWLFRCNYEAKRVDNPQYKDVPALYEQNCCPITILENEKWDKYCYNKLKIGEEPTWDDFPNKNKETNTKTVPKYIRSFMKLYEVAKKEDVLVVLEYKDGEKNERPRKLGILHNVNTIDVFKTDQKLYDIFCLKLNPKSVITTCGKEFAILNGLFLPNVTLGEIISRKVAINELYRSLKSGKNQISLCLENLPNEKIEDLCAYWLQSDHAGKDLKLKTIYVENGELNFPVLDIMGKTFFNEVLAAQVSYTKDDQTIINKVKKLVKIHTEIHVMFTLLSQDEFNQKCKKKGEDEAQTGTDVKSVSLKEVWEDLYNDEKGKEFILKLFKDSYPL